MRSFSLGTLLRRSVMRWLSPPSSTGNILFSILTCAENSETPEHCQLRPSFRRKKTIGFEAVTMFTQERRLNRQQCAAFLSQPNGTGRTIEHPRPGFQKKRRGKKQEIMDWKFSLLEHAESSGASANCQKEPETLIISQQPCLWTSAHAKFAARNRKQDARPASPLSTAAGSTRKPIGRTTRNFVKSRIKLWKTRPLEGKNTVFQFIRYLMLQKNVPKKARNSLFLKHFMS